MQDELLYTLFQPGKTLLLKKSANYNCIPYIESVMRVIMADASGMLAQLAEDGSAVPKPVVFVNFDGTTEFTFVAPGFYKYAQVLPTTPVIDLESNLPSTMEAFFPQYFQPQPAPAPVPPAVQVPGVPAPAPVAAPQPEPDWLRQFQPGTVYVLASSSNPALARYVGKIFQSTHASVSGVLGVPERSSGLTEAVFLPFDGASEFTLNPAGTYSFASGLAAGQQVYNPTTCTYTYVEEFCPAYGYVYDPYPVVYYDTFVPALAVGLAVGYGCAMAYDPYYVDPFWPYW
ncbi:MAG: hypothetical protein KGS72_24920 [Cyanobacteria bacterium REEB67]|nr:hypothetical protein [Cyanobacteria bacterium REEB67]